MGAFYPSTIANGFPACLLGKGTLVFCYQLCGIFRRILQLHYQNNWYSATWFRFYWSTRLLLLYNCCNCAVTICYIRIIIYTCDVVFVKLCKHCTTVKSFVCTCAKLNKARVSEGSIIGHLFIICFWNDNNKILFQQKQQKHATDQNIYNWDICLVLLFYLD